MNMCIVTGAAGLIGAETVRFFAEKGMDVAGIDNDMRRQFFGEEASTAWSRERLQSEVRNYRHFDLDIRDTTAIAALFARYGKGIAAVVHTAAQPSHDWAACDPQTDFAVNASSTLNLLEATRQYCPDAAFIFTSTNKVYGDRPNHLPLIELDQRWELDPGHPFAAQGINETMSIDGCMHSLFGASKLAADILVQEYGRYFGLKTACFRGGCLTGPGHSGTRLHGFLAYLARCAVTREPYTVLGYKGKQVRDNIHSYDLVNAFWHFVMKPRSGEVYNIGGGRHANCSVLEAIGLCESLTGRSFNWTYSDQNRAGDHIWWISDASRFKSHYPDWNYRYDLKTLLAEIINEAQNRFERLRNAHAS
jgi:CDP-paratose 2-epimerase